MDEVIDFLEEKNMEDKTINKILNYFLRIKVNDPEKTIKDIYGIFSYAGLNAEQIEMLIDKNITLLSMSKQEIIKIAYVINKTSLVDEFFENTTVIPRLCAYKRMFMRNFVLENSNYKRNGYTGKLSPEANKCYRKKNPTNLLICDEEQAYGSKHRFSLDCSMCFKEYVTSDDELEKILNKYISNGGIYKNVDDYLNKCSMLFYQDYLIKKKKKKEKEEVSIK